MTSVCTRCGERLSNLLQVRVFTDHSYCTGYNISVGDLRTVDTFTLCPDCWVQKKRELQMAWILTHGDE